MPRNRRNNLGRTVAEWGGPIAATNIPDLKEFKWVEARINQGMVTMIDAADIPLSALQLAKNATIRFDVTERREGHDTFGPTKPNEFNIVKLATIKLPDGTGYTIRFTPFSVHVLDTGYYGGPAWIPIVGTLNSTIADRIQTAIILDKMVFTNNGADPIQLIDFDTQTHDHLANNINFQKDYRYITGFANRVIGAAHREVNEVEIGWSAEHPNLDEWDNAINSSAGVIPLVDNPSNEY